MYQSFSWNDISEAVGSVAWAASSSSPDRFCAHDAIGNTDDNNPTAMKTNLPARHSPPLFAARRKFLTKGAPPTFARQHGAPRTVFGADRTAYHQCSATFRTPIKPNIDADQ
ncbi:MAG: hypothetical protein IPO75_08475 [Betaproteobacteria bacterium]|nr:hypothetical protein [Betaproteobacteria bacterium]